MLRKRAVPPLLLCLALVLALGGCGLPWNKPAQPEPTQSPEPSAGVPVRLYDVPGEEAQPEAVPVISAPAFAPAEDGSLWGSYYNDFLRAFLTLREDGSFQLRDRNRELGGTYVLEGENLELRYDGGSFSATVDTDGDLSLKGFSGYFLRDWARWDIHGDELGLPTEPENADVSVSDNGDGSFRRRDYALGLVFTYDGSMTVLDGSFLGAVGAADGQGGYVIGRNVTDLYRTHVGSDDEFLEDYIKTFVFRDFEVFAGSLLSFSDLQLHHDAITGRLADATLHLSSAGTAAAARVILYTSTYADGTVNYICKTVFAPEGTDGALEALSLAVRDMGAVRLS